MVSLGACSPWDAPCRLGAVTASRSELLGVSPGVDPDRRLRAPRLDGVRCKDLVTVAQQGDEGKLRPALVVQADGVPQRNTHVAALLSFSIDLEKSHTALVTAPILREPL